MSGWQTCPKCQCMNLSRECCVECGRDLKGIAIDNPTPAPTAEAAPDSASTKGPVSAEDWWAKLAILVSEKMRNGGVKSFRIELNSRGNYEFEVTPTGL